jgi:hypothetical protein
MQNLPAKSPTWHALPPPARLMTTQLASHPWRSHPCLATILDISRLPSLVRLTDTWPGAVSAAVLAEAGADADGQLQAVRAALPLADWRRVRVSVVENVGYVRTLPLATSPNAHTTYPLAHLAATTAHRASHSTCCATSRSCGAPRSWC